MTSDTSEESAVLVEHEPPLVDEDETSPGKPSALQIVSIGSAEDDYAFRFDQHTLTMILSKVPADYKVAVVSVVGAFRTGKSFLLGIFLRYLAAQDNDDVPWYQQIDAIDAKDGFEWKAGSDRNTTGIWMWSHPHLDHQKRQAVLLVDSQGLFDHETSMGLTASIFGFATLLSSYQIYNIDKRIQEDNLQQLALFSEYARIAVDDPANSDQNNSDDKDAKLKPFQVLDFLVRDWQHYEGEEQTMDEMEASMQEYLNKVLSERKAEDLKDTREQIMACFEKMDCFGLCHPGFAVTKKKFQGDLSDIEGEFIQLVDRYCRKVFDNVECKVIHGQELSAPELGSYVAAYASLFASGAKFPEAATLLKATASANNSNAVSRSIALYKEAMDRVAGPSCSHYVRPEELSGEDAMHKMASLKLFDSMATFGDKSSIDESRNILQEQLASNWSVYESLNQGRNPLASLEIYLLPLVVAVVAFVLRSGLDWTCSPYATVCRASSDVLSHIYAVVLWFMVIVGFTKVKQIQESFCRIQQALQLLLSDAPVAQKAKAD